MHIAADNGFSNYNLPILQLIAIAALFLAAKSEETPRPLNNVLRASCEIFHKQDFNFLSYLLPVVSNCVSYGLSHHFLPVLFVYLKKKTEMLVFVFPYRNIERKIKYACAPCLNFFHGWSTCFWNITNLYCLLLNLKWFVLALREILIWKLLGTYNICIYKSSSDFSVRYCCLVLYLCISVLPIFGVFCLKRRERERENCNLRFSACWHDIRCFKQDWFEQYRERVIEAEQMILTTLNFELNVQHPYAPLTSVLNKLGLSQTVLVNLALNLVSEG